jgi:hypothetical protein
MLESGLAGLFIIGGFCIFIIICAIFAKIEQCVLYIMERRHMFGNHVYPYPI